MSQPRQPRVFISYSHDTAEHKARVLAFANRLRDEGVRAVIDQYETAPPQGWPRWMMDEVEQADFVLAVCTERYEKRVRGHDDPGRGHGSDWEGTLITQEIYESKANTKCIPIVFELSDEKHIPIYLKSATRYLVDREGGYRGLYRHLTGQPAVMAPAVGVILPMPPEQLSESFPPAPPDTRNSPLGPATVEKAFALLDEARSFGPERKELLDELDRLIASVPNSAADPVLLALKEFAAYERDRSGEVYRLQHGVKLLDELLAFYDEQQKGPDATHIEVGLLQEKINLFLTEDLVSGERTPYLHAAIDRAKRVLEGSIDRSSLTAIRFMVLLSEALKELAMVEKDPAEHLQYTSDARHYCEMALDCLKNVDRTRNSSLLQGSAYRHLAVTYELEADTLPDRSQGIECYEKWRAFSGLAARILEGIGETTVRAYAMINLASSCTRLADFEVNGPKRLKLYEESKRMLTDAIPLFRQVEEQRGIGWAYVHLCERGIKELALDPAENNTSLEELESLANRAISALRLGADHLALGLAYQYLGMTLYSIVRARGKTGVRLDRAIESLKAAVAHLERTAYYRGAGEACLWKAQCHLALWKHNRDSSELVNAINELVHGSTSTAKAVEAPGFLEELCRLLDLPAAGHFERVAKQEWELLSQLISHLNVVSVNRVIARFSIEVSGRCPPICLRRIFD